MWFDSSISERTVVKGVLGCASVPYEGYGVFLSGKGIGWVLLWLHLHMIAVKLDRRQGEALTNWHSKCIFPVCVETIIRGTLNLHELMNNLQSKHMELKVWIKWKLIKMFTLWCSLVTFDRYIFYFFYFIRIIPNLVKVLALAEKKNMGMIRKG